MDALSNLLQAVRLKGGVFLDARFTAPWCVSARIGPEDCRPFLTEPCQVIAYHYVTQGRLQLQIEGEPAVEVRAGEAVLLPQNDPHVLGSSVALRPVSADDLMQPVEGGGLTRINHGGGGEATHLVCGFLGSDQHRNPLIATLPRVLTIDMARAGSDEWIESSLRFAVRGLNEGKVGGSTVMSKLSELMFVEAVRSYAAALPAEQTGWLAGLRDQFVGKALALVHGKPGHRWTTESIAREVSLSRSAFADRFTAVVGVPPKRYLISWRLQVAKEKLREGRQPIARVAYEVGYESEAAFTRAFKREFGMPPATWRDKTQPIEK
jgi:AraC-like DNA-binding protein